MTAHTPTIEEQARATAAGAAERFPADVVAAFTADQAELDARGVPAGVAVPGTGMPDGDLLDVHGAPTSLARVRDGKPAVVVFYRGAWCPYCNIALRTYQDQLVPALADRGVELIAVSPQKPDGSLSAAESNELTFAVVSDPGNQLAGALGILTQSSAESLAAQRKIGLDVTEVNADGGAALPMPTVVVVDAAGVIRWIDVHPNYTTRSEVPDILRAVDAAVQ
ncbi:peroxiredoxin [Mycolicibacterium madagascariense]|uniref:thioredoxin-dependent peroxiredoxin n=1 Tax=Mycolicibacterium madagascariense TaxID=212765 RepID=A0A7I7XE67_9MYCO|nr:peroxiredoxin-like family protein [Mycolicibacterium madagascariense]MCV7011739.1 AhpC/TSA family protein [Mycolicibacterium madagascariense]BBZ27377.1 peroxiredoxin [Mycolicibacterium madagascariense]